jgi:hypothetical protein
MRTPQDFAGEMAAKTDEALQEMFVRPEDWSSPALEAAKSELHKRNLPPRKVVERHCPVCLAPLESGDGRTAVCPAHGGRFKILFLRTPLPVPPPAQKAPPWPPAAGPMCSQHPSVPAFHECGDCGTPVCETCASHEPDGRRLCPECAGRHAPPAAPALPAGIHCVQHANLPATAQCQGCGAFLCDTCKFELSDGLCLCPVCATTPRTTLSPKRRKMLIGSYALAVWGTLVLGALMGGAFRGMITSKDDEQAFGLILLLLLLPAAIAGVSLGVGIMNRRSPNSIAVWIATLWNAAVLGLFIMLCIIGQLMK